jgi:hypothetical protein
MRIEYTIKSVYGQDLMYVKGEAAYWIQCLTGRKTITTHDIEALTYLGHNVVNVFN